MDVGSAVPNPAVLDQRGEMRPLLEPPARWRVVFFYPKDSTPGCTTENREFSALAEAFAKAGAELIGVSRDSLASHQRFCERERLVHTLVSDDEGELCTLFDVIREKNLYGRVRNR
jgi:thioredoxin-dependent peroxiredoxin